MRKIVNLLLIINFFNYFSENLLVPVYAVFTNKIGGDLFTAGSALAVSYAVIGIGIIISGKFAEKYHTEKLQMVVGLAMDMLVIIGYINVKSPFGLYVAFVFSGLAIAISQPAFSGLFSSVIPEGKHTSRWGYMYGLIYFTSAVSALVSGFVTQQFGFTALFYLMLFTAGLALLGSLYLLRLPQQDLK